MLAKNRTNNPSNREIEKILADAVANHFENLTPVSISDFQSITGKGATAIAVGKAVLGIYLQYHRYSTRSWTTVSRLGLSAQPHDCGCC